MKKNLKVLIIEDAEDDALLNLRELKRGGYEPAFVRVDTPQDMQRQLEVASWDLILADYRMPRFNAIEALALLQGTGRDIPFIIVSGTIGEETAVAAMKAGAHDYIMKGHLARLVPAVEREIREARVRQNRRKAEKQLRESEKRLRAILRSVGDGLVVTDNENRLVMMNRTAEDWLGVSSGEVVNLPIDQAISLPQFLEPLQTTLAAGKGGLQFDFDLPARSAGKNRHLKAKTSAILDKTGKPMGIIITMTDMTREWQLDRMKTEFISTAAHELRTPLTTIQGFAELLTTREDLDQEERKRFLTYIFDQSVGLGRIINDLLDISRIESGKRLPLAKAPCDLKALIQRTVEQCIARTTLHRFELSLPEAACEIAVDKGKMTDVLDNILTNAVKYSPRGGRILVTGELRDGDYQVSVEDEGVGMTADQVESVFDRFYRADSSTSAPGGLGIGMSVVKHIIKAHGGRIRVESERGMGTRVSFSIPVIRCEEAGPK